MLNDIQETANENYSSLKRIYNLEDYYEHNLLPKMLSFPRQYISRIEQKKEEKRLNEEKQLENLRQFEKMTKVAAKKKHPNQSKNASSPSKTNNASAKKEAAANRRTNN